MRNIIISAILLSYTLLLFGAALADGNGYPYNSPNEINGILEKIAKENKTAKLHTLAKTPGGHELLLLEFSIGKKLKPAILVVANMEANYPIASEAALNLCQMLSSEWKGELEKYTWYIIPIGNPDGYANFFNKPLYKNFLNSKSFNKDMDNASDEDGPDDLNNDGFITQMRQVHPEGQWIEVSDNPLLMRKADRDKGETGKYRLFAEGLDNDDDGEINEDGPGGVNPGRNFPHNFSHYTGTDGLWSASEVETFSILRFAFDHSEIAMVINFSRTNTLKEVPASSRQAEAAQSTYKLPRWMASQAGLDHKKEYPMEVILEVAKSLFGDPSITEERVVRFLGLGAAVNPDKKDIPYWKEITEKYKEFMKEAGYEGETLESPRFSSGCIEEWAYYQYGVPTYCFDFWTLPKPEKKEEPADSNIITSEKLKEMTNEEFIALGEDKINEFLKANDMPSQYSAAMVIKGLEGGMMNTRRMAKMMEKMKKDKDTGGADETEEALFALNNDAFVKWQEYDHPTLGKVEIGGMKPYSTVLPPAEEVDSLIIKQIPFVRDLVGLLPDINIGDVIIEEKSKGVWKIEAWIVNSGFLPYPTHQGQRCRRPCPTIVTIDDISIEILEGKQRNTLSLLAGSGGYDKVSWLVKGKSGESVSLEVFGPSIGKDVKSITL